MKTSEARFRPVVLLPTYNNAGTLERVLSAVDSLKLPILVVNDGSTDATQDILAPWADAKKATVVRHERNLGKAAALRTGFRAAGEAGFTHAATIDSDGQHDPADLPMMLDLARRAPPPGVMVLGVRSFDTENYPPKNILARRLSNFAILLETGARASDSQCGL